MRPTEDDNVRASLGVGWSAVKGAVHTMSSSPVMLRGADPRSGPESSIDAGSLRLRLMFAMPMLLRFQGAFAVGRIQALAGDERSPRPPSADSEKLHAHKPWTRKIVAFSGFAAGAGNEDQSGARRRANEGH